MSYADLRWQTDYTWEWYLLNLGNDAPPALAAAQPEPSTPRRWAWATCWSWQAVIANDAPTATLTMAARLPESYLPTRKLGQLLEANVTLAAADARYSLQMLDADGQVLSTQPFTATALSDAPDPAGGAASFFGVAVPYANGTARIQITSDADVLTTRTVSAHAPVVTVLSPNGGETMTATMTVRWTRSDADWRPAALHDPVQP